MKKYLIDTEIPVTLVVPATDEVDAGRVAMEYVATVVREVPRVLPARVDTEDIRVALDVPRKYSYKVTEIPSE